MKLSPALSAAVGGDLSEAECAAFEGPLYLQGATSLDGIEQFSNVERVQLLGCEVGSLQPLASLPKLKGLQVLCTPASDLRPLVTSKTLLDLELNFTFVEDIAPLLEIPQLHWLKLYGNPLSDRSFHELLPELRRRAIPNWGKPPLVEASTDVEWQLARKIWDAGTGRCYGYIPRSDRPTLVRPGVGHDGFPVDFYDYEIPAMREVFTNPDWAAYGIFKKFGTKKPGSLDFPRERFSASWLGGNHKDACLWIEQDREIAWDGVETEHYYGFVSRFPKETFFLDLPWYVDKMEREHQVAFPAWFRNLRTMTLAGVRPTSIQPIEFELEAFTQPSPMRTGGRYKVGYRGYYNDADRDVYLRSCGMFPIGDITTEGQLGRSMLAINLRQPDDRRIYEFTPQAVHAAAQSGEDPLPLFCPVFSTWGQLWESVTAIIDEGEVVKATR